jgi:hypothetical protein
MVQKRKDHIDTDSIHVFSLFISLEHFLTMEHRRTWLLQKISSVLTSGRSIWFYSNKDRKIATCSFLKIGTDFEHISFDKFGIGFRNMFLAARIIYNHVASLLLFQSGHDMWQDVGRLLKTRRSLLPVGRIACNATEVLGTDSQFLNTCCCSCCSFCIVRFI